MIQFSEETFNGFGRKHMLKVLYEMARQVKPWESEEFTESVKVINQASAWANARFAELSLNTVQSARDLEGLSAQLERELKLDVADVDFLVSHKDKESEFSLGTPMPVHFILENIRSAFNVGSCFRSAESFHIESVQLTGYTPTPENSKTSRSALGTDEWLPWQYSESSSQAMERLRESHPELTIYAVETAENSTSLFELDTSFPAAFVLGNERFGLAEETLRSTDQVIHIPMSGRKNSLNISVCAGILLYQSRLQWTK